MTLARKFREFHDNKLRSDFGRYDDTVTIIQATNDHIMLELRLWPASQVAPAAFPHFRMTLVDSDTHPPLGQLSCQLFQDAEAYRGGLNDAGFAGLEQFLRRKTAEMQASSEPAFE